MPSLKKLSIIRLRNIDSQTIKPVPGINIFIGANGSGKTSILEAIHLLGLARSFRSIQFKPIIRHGENDCAVFGELDDGVTLGVGKSIAGSEQQIKIAGYKAESAAELAFRLPLQLFNSDTFKILEGGPTARRKFMDWGVFHVEQRFFQSWRQTQRVLHHRNHLLKKGAAWSEIQPWTKEFVRQADEIDKCRSLYIEKFLPALNEVLMEMLPLPNLILEYDRGWDSATSLMHQLEAGFERELKYGHTRHGPHRADIKIRAEGQDAAITLSRGQQKLLVSAMKIAQGLLLDSETGKRCLYLIDDLPSELDRDNRALVCRMLGKLESQVFITCVETGALDGCWEGEVERELFHVKHGKISPMNRSVKSA